MHSLILLSSNPNPYLYLAPCLMPSVVVLEYLIIAKTKHGISHSKPIDTSLYNYLNCVPDFTISSVYNLGTV